MLVERSALVRGACVPYAASLSVPRLREVAVTYEQAVFAAKEGQAIRHPDMADGWVIRWHERARGLFNINPHTGSDYLFTPTAEERERVDWTA